MGGGGSRGRPAGYLAGGVDAQLLQLLGPRRGAQLRLLPRGARRASAAGVLGGAAHRPPGGHPRGGRGALLRPAAARRPGPAAARLRHARGAAAAARPSGPPARRGAPGLGPSPSPLRRRRRLLPGGAGGGTRRSAGGSCPAGGGGGPAPASRRCAPQGRARLPPARPPCAGAARRGRRPRGKGGGTRGVRSRYGAIPALREAARKVALKRGGIAGSSVARSRTPASLRCCRSRCGPSERRYFVWLNHCLPTLCSLRPPLEGSIFFPR